eukprot:TRINITY_DN5660_c0_g1_i1.p1 TRINITY_DN5660_c0_g1~~TRINITY_DN5660_c0_g1_i1.p1  ORF type:complete len:111 (-),score=17.37 TRINITY_DN5660_c0_g1_i1:155-487(-)
MNNTLFLLLVIPVVFCFLDQENTPNIELYDKLHVCKGNSATASALGRDLDIYADEEKNVVMLVKTFSRADVDHSVPIQVFDCPKKNWIECAKESPLFSDFCTDLVKKPEL